MRILFQKLILGLFSFFPIESYKIFRFLSNNRLPGLLLTLQECGLDMRVVYDIGANKGHWAEYIRNVSCMKSQFFLFEANAVHESDLKRSGHKYFITTLSSEEKFVEFYSLGGSGTGDSYYLETRRKHSNTESQRVMTSTLDQIVGRYGLPQADFIKIDTQGSELDILKGATGVLANASLILVECPILQYNVGAPSISEYINFLLEHDFFPIDLVSTHYVNQNHLLVQADVVFLKRRLFEKFFGELEIGRS
jgi:FkbM family methyltransferase